MTYTLVLIEPDHSYNLTTIDHVGTCVETYDGRRYDYFKFDMVSHTLWARRVIITKPELGVD